MGQHNFNEFALNPFARCCQWDRGGLLSCVSCMLQSSLLFSPASTLLFPGCCLVLPVIMYTLQMLKRVATARHIYSSSFQPRWRPFEGQMNGNWREHNLTPTVWRTLFKCEPEQPLVTAAANCAQGIALSGLFSWRRLTCFIMQRCRRRTVDKLGTFRA